MGNYIGVTVNETPGVEKNVKGTAVGSGLDAMDVALWIDESGTPRKLDVADFQAVPTPTTVTAFTVSVTSTPAALASHAGKALVIQNDPDSAQDVFVGDASSQPLQLLPGQTLSLDISNSNALYVKTVTATATANCLVVS